ncbi:hypothetical protein MIH18_05565 [Marinobacter sp. M3C]|uniref:type I-F CRISPR-associated protein Csy2 n=1 Tax=unclassified Marinobacter TaxID=83889 RepID=UPI00200CC82A|nr:MULTISPECIES: type I-F CRISPR-associated protein Csy2 [unclassified Marinobacter]MCL1486017.1 hypothetical protein [Marinobacter sp.]UQG57412.1 hypothetical protein MIH16_07155 [Marinobacter sp. M4C]UQG61410.1 hypothetical protein MIH18_05565 [Marinobacter sp. M3C]UQG66216.1 hypothetical protein MIH17_07155 [Marinobacter sp. M2C]UQG70496.1 hypothetical protein MIH19_07150 [Marinobacter sp. M1C]
MSDQYLILPRLSVQAANAYQCPLFLSACPVSAAVLFAHALARGIGAEESPRGVAYLHHDAQHLGEYDQYGNFVPQQRRGASFIDKDDYAGGAATPSLSLQPTASVHLSVSLVIAFDEDEELDTAAVERFLSGARFAGGSVTTFGQPKRFDSIEEASKRLPNGFWVVDRIDLLAQPDKAPHVTLLELLMQRSADIPWLTPIVAGYRALTAAEHKEGGRFGYAHAYGEPLIGLAQFQSSTQRRAANAAVPFWSLRWTDDVTCLIQQTQ